MRASIIIPAYKPHELLRDCLKAIALNTTLSTVEVIVVCNGSPRESADFVLSMDPSFRLVWYEEPLGFTRAVNIGFSLASADSVITLNSDAHLLPHQRDGWLDRLLVPLDDPTVGITGLGMMWLEHYGEFLPFYCVALKRKLLDELGPLDMAFSPGYGEDTDFCIRAKRAGYRLVQVDKVTPDHVNKMNLSDFPIYHRGEGSFTDKEARAKYLENTYRVLGRKWGSK